MNKKLRIIIILILIILFSLLTVVQSFKYSGSSGGTDLRNRVVAARLLGKGYSPYFYKWKPSDGERLLDPNDDPLKAVNGNTVTPAVLYVFYPLAILNYPDIRVIWTALQIAAAILIVWLMLKRYEGSSPLTAAAIVLFGLLFSAYWLTHIERGQIHILYLLFFVLIYYFYTGKAKNAEFISGLLGGLFLFFRPFALLICLGFFLHGRIKWIKGCITGVTAGMLIFVAPDPSNWKDYFLAMKQYGYECMGLNIRTGRTVATIPVYPQSIEGTTNFKITHGFDLNCMPAMYGIIRKTGINYTPLISYLTCGVILLILSIFFYRERSRSNPVKLFLFGFLTYKVFELFLLSWRSPYSLILWIFPLFLIIQQIQNRLVPMTLLISALLFLHNFPFYFNYQAFSGEAILLSLVIYLTFCDTGMNTLKEGKDYLYRISA